MNKTLDAAKAEIATFCGHRLLLRSPFLAKNSQRKKKRPPPFTFISFIVIYVCSLQERARALALPA